MGSDINDKFIVMCEKVKDAELFYEIKDKNIIRLLDSLDAHIEVFSKNDVIVPANTVITEFGLIVSGKVHLVQYDYWGNHSIINEQCSGTTLAIDVAILDDVITLVDIIASETCEVVFMNSETLKRLDLTCPAPQALLLRNISKIIAKRNYESLKKIEQLSKRSIRDKILTFLSMTAIEKQKRNFSIPYTRQELADYLSVNVSALSRELGKLQEEGFLSYKHNKFFLKK